MAESLTNHFEKMVKGNAKLRDEFVELDRQINNIKYLFNDNSIDDKLLKELLLIEFNKLSDLLNKADICRKNILISLGDCIHSKW